jgi:hypothetical protein
VDFLFISLPLSLVYSTVSYGAMMDSLSADEKQTKTAVIVGNRDILSASIKTLLLEKSDWLVFGIEETDDVEQFVASVLTFQPDLVIIHQGYCKNPHHPALQLLQDHTDIKVVLLSLEDNFVNVYNKQTILIEETSDLLSVFDSIT